MAVVSARLSAAEETALLCLAGRIVEEFQDDDYGGLDGGDVQDLAYRAGLLKKEQRTTPCDAGCRCVEYYGSGETVDCYRITPLGFEALAAHRLAVTP